LTGQKNLRQKRWWQKNGGQKDGVVKNGRARANPLEKAIAVGSVPMSGASIRPPMLDRFR
jgi:hypothetical protein